MRRGIPAVLMLIVILLYLPALSLGMVWDDHDLIEQDARVTGPLTPASLFRPYWDGTPAASAASSATGPRYSRPLVTLSFAVQHGIHGLEPRAYHAFNIGVHALAVAALYSLLAGTFGPLPGALGAALFAVFPTQVEPTAWIAGRTDLLAGALGFLALLCHRHSSGLDRWSVAAGLALLGSILSKETGWIFPVLMWADDRFGVPVGGSAFLASTYRTPPLPPLIWRYFPWLRHFSGGRRPGWVDGPRERAVSPQARVDARIPARTPAPTRTPSPTETRLRWLPAVLALLLAGAVRLVSLSSSPVGSSSSLGGGPVWVIPLRMAASAGYYLQTLLWPWNPSALPAGRALPDPHSLTLWLGLLALLCVPLGFARALRRGHRQGALGLLWIMLGLLPVLNLVPISAPSPVAERFWYIPLGGVAWLIALGLASLRDGSRTLARVAPLAQVATLALLFVCILASAFRIPEWKTDHSLWEAELHRHGLRHPLEARNLGLARLLDGDRAGAERVWRQALERGLGGGSPHYYDLGIDLCRLLIREQRPGEATSIANQLLAQQPPTDSRIRLEALVAETRR